MITAIVLMNVERQGVNNVVAQLAKVPGVSEVFSVSGNYDIVAILRVKTSEEISTLVTEDIMAIKEITKTETMLAFKAYNQNDLESAFSIGFE